MRLFRSNKAEKATTKMKPPLVDTSARKTPHLRLKNYTAQG
jgi:hypothetical protein